MNKPIKFNMHDVVKAGHYISTVIAIKVTTSEVKYILAGKPNMEYNESDLEPYNVE